MWTVKRLGNKWGFANQLFRYAHLRQVAGDDYGCPAWIGQHLFGLSDPPVTRPAKALHFRFPYNSDYYDKTLFRSLFRPTQTVKEQIPPVLDMLRGMGHELIGLHLRRGDYGTFKRRSARWCFVAPVEWYRRWLEEHDKGRAILVIASDDKSVAEDFRGYSVVTMPETIPEAPYYPDFYALTQCDIVLISNSTFSFAASMLGRATECWRPRLSKQGLIPYDPWNSLVVLKDERY